LKKVEGNIFYFIKKLDETSVRGSNFYITILAYLTDITQSLDFISKKSYKHINNNHKALRFNPLASLLTEIEEIFNTRKFERISYVLDKREDVLNALSEKIQKQIDRTRTEESSPKNTTLYFNLLLETKDLVTGIMNLMEEYYTSYNKS